MSWECPQLCAARCDGLQTPKYATATATSEYISGRVKGKCENIFSRQPCNDLRPCITIILRMKHTFADSPYIEVSGFFPNHRLDNSFPTSIDFQRHRPFCIHLRLRIHREYSVLPKLLEVEKSCHLPVLR